ncbi:DNA polymerase III subunit delta' [Ruania halotolerans]|uniref:DNA polymerase III subunit delta' n=1 Tax=Ruania halotolerans TaxID=2897773 RepID=UPI001E3500CE|nr:DNA polymerase III subunit delta' [Ruania halotolerans]UFU07153.1 DNA polymerase III subunit delta' [Ruania halotolerans]
MSVWTELVGQDAAVEVLSAATTNAASMTHAWLITGPPGSGRSVAARAFAAALQDPGDPDGTGHDVRTVLAGTHADVTVFATEKVQISISEARELVGLAQRSPSQGRWRVIIVEDADRMTERTANVLLKAIEEPPPRTVWILCAPSPMDVLVTIRSRCRLVNLRVPSAEAVAELLIRRDGVEPDLALTCARAAQSHIGMARRLATHDDARAYRDTVLAIPSTIRGVGDAVLAAQRLVDDATEQSKVATTERDAAEKSELMRTIGAEEGARIPPALRAQIRQLEEEQKRRSRRALIDLLDRAMIDLLSYYRDVLVSQLGSDVPLVNQAHAARITAMAEHSTPEQSVHRMEAVGLARTRIAAGAAPLLAVEALTIALRPQG